MHQSGWRLQRTVDAQGWHFGGEQMRTCGMCGTSTSHFELRWYKYDNGEQFREAVCIPCADQHTTMVNR
jgi:hypothetical protein